MLLSFVLLVAGMVSAADGVPIQYDDTAKGDTALVFIHCWGCDRTLWENQTPLFAKDYRVVTIDLPGHGESGKERKQWSVESFADDVKRVVTKLGLKRVVLIGSSMGGPIALEAARQMPDRVVGIVPVDTLQNVDSRPPKEQIDAIMAQMRADYKGVLPGIMNQFFFSPSTQAAVKEKMIGKALAMPTDVGLPMLEALFRYDSIQALKSLKVPIKAINSDLTPTSLENNRKYAPQFDAVIIKGTGHYPMLEDPARFNELLRGVLNEILAAKKSAVAVR
jgi:pimeloyl-ACP methyl ester carboxylesterase